MGLGLDPVRWRVVGATVAGAGHRARGHGGEDAFAAEVDGDRGALFVAVADGAGSAPAAALGSRTAVAAAMAGLRAGVAVDVALVLAREALEDAAGAAARPLSDVATTLLVAKVDDGVLSTAQVGDGAVVIRRDRTYEVVAADCRGEYLNETCFVTSSSWRTQQRHAVVPIDDVDGVAVLTDGLQLLAFDLASGAPHVPFFDPFFGFASSGGSATDLALFLGSDRVAERTDDDVTLVVATPIPPP